MSIEEDTQRLMALVSEYGSFCEWNGARPGDDITDKRGLSLAVVRDAIRLLLATELGTLSPAIGQLECGNAAGALKMLQLRVEAIGNSSPTTRD